MPFLSQKDNREIMQSLVPAKKIEVANFSETFAAGVGQVFDEELSISSMLNMQGFNQRKEQVKAFGDSGAFNISEYTSAVGDVDYKRIGADFPEFKLKDDRTLFDERTETLKKRREYAADVFERGNGMAQFLGMATAYMLDPINIATMPIATMGTATKSLTTLGRALTVGRNEAGLAIAAELMIQPLVYQHKHDINSPFEFKDALLNIVTAATGAAAIGGAVGGISGYLKSVREKAITQPLDKDSVMALESLARVEDDLNLNPEKINLDFEKIEVDFIQEIKTTLLVDASQKITRGERNKLTAELSSLESRLNKVIEDDVVVSPVKGKPARKVKQEARAEVKRTADEERLTLRDQIDGIKTKLEADRLGGEAAANLSRIEAGIIPDSFKRQLDKIKSDTEIEVDQKFLVETNNKMQSSNQPSKIKENYIQPERKAATTGSITQRERAVVERNGLTKDYDADIEAFKALENPRIVQDDVMVDAGDFMKSIEDEMKGIEEVLTCAI